MQYRMNATITKLANNLTYKGALVCGNDTVKHATYARMPAAGANPSAASLPKWIQRVLSTHIDQSVCFLNTGNVYQQCMEYMAGLRSSDPLIAMSQYVRGEDDSTNMAGCNGEQANKRVRLYSNYCEAGILLQLIGALKAAGVDGANIGVIAPYALQVELLKQIIHKCDVGNENVEVNTVDQYQGRDKEVGSI